MRALKQNGVSEFLPCQPIARLLGHDGPIQDVCFSTEGKYCLTAGHDRTVRLWNPARLDPAHHRPPARDLRTQLLPQALPIQSYSHTHGVTAISVNPTTLLAASGKSVVVTDLVTTKPLRTYSSHTGVVNAVAMTSELYLSASYDGTVRLWDAKSRSYDAIQCLEEATDSVTCVMVHGAMIRTASVDGIVRTYDVRQGQVHCDNVGSPVVSMDLTKDGQCVVIATLEGDVVLMEASSGQLLNTYERAHTAGKYALQCCVTADDRYIASGSEDGRAVLYDVVTGTMVQSLEGHKRATCALATHPKRDHTSVVVTGSYDGTAVVWAHDSSFLRVEID